MSERSWAGAVSKLQSEPFLLRMETTGTNSQNWPVKKAFSGSHPNAKPPIHARISRYLQIVGKQYRLVGGEGGI